MDADSDGGGESSDFSTTNVQEKGVDEGDVVKNDGNYAYIVSKDQGKVFVVDVYPPGSMEIISTIDIEDGNIKELYLSGNKLTILGTKGGSSYYYYRDPYYQSDDDPPAAFVKVFNIDDRREPVLFREDEIEGNFISSRMIDGYFYMIMSRYCSNVENESTLPAPANEIYYADEYDTSYSFIGVSSINVHSRDEVPYGRMMLFGYSSEIYVSTNNVYLTQSKRMSWFEQMEREIDDVVVPILPNREKWLLEGVDNADLTRQEKMSEKDRIIGEYLDNISESQENDFYEKWREGKVNFTKKIAPELEMTAIHRISIQKGYINFKASGEVPGYILNRFSMGEYDSHFRIATTTGHVSRTGVGTAKNHLFVLNMDLETVGNISDIAPGERIYSARFMGKRAYMVTFDKVDPFFVIDVSDPYKPEILGELKIPGYSDYLHPYDENHIIGLGLDTVLAEGGQFSWYQGVKLSMFDVTDFNNPKETSKYIIGDRGTHSIAQRDPHAFLFSLRKNLLVIPIQLYEIDEAKTNVEPNTRGEFTWEGAYVFDVTAEYGFRLKGRITHHDGGFSYNYRSYGYELESIYRSFYISDVLYTVSFSALKASSMDALVEINKVDLPNTE
jgi:uncharacterized secreted protein with C-terminal beta-propeller domain